MSVSLVALTAAAAVLAGAAVLLLALLRRERARVARAIERATRNQTRWQRLGEVLEATPDLVGMFDAEGRGEWANTAARTFFGLGADVSTVSGLELYGKSSLERVLTEVLPTAQRTGVWTGEITISRPDGGESPASHALFAHRRPDGSVDHYSTITRDLSAQRDVEEQLARAELYDGLTGLPNRVLFMDRLAHAVVRSRRAGSMLAVLTIGIDRFKLVNDTYGHDVGDDLIVRVGQRLAEAAGALATVARFSGDTFWVQCEDIVGDQEALEVAERISTAVAAPFEVGDDRVFLTCSIGVAVSSETPMTSESLLRDAEAALHRAKESGPGRHQVFAEHVRASAVHRLRTANDLHRALSEHEFRVVYQPEVRLSDGHISAVEALVRWHHPDRGLVPPDEFVRLAEDTGLITQIGAWVLEEALTQARSWGDARWDGRPLPVWVNLSSRQVANPTLVADVAAALDQFAVDPVQLGLEITETALLEDADAGLATLAALRALGVRLAVDDFGTGFSSLSYLKRLPVDAVKVDRSFIQGLGKDDDDSAIVAAVSGMASALRLTVIAEGVETRSQLAALRRIGCELAQGYVFSTPQPAVTMTRLLESDRAAALFRFDDEPGEQPLPERPPAPRPAAAS